MAYIDEVNGRYIEEEYSNFNLGETPVIKNVSIVCNDSVIKKLIKP